MVIRKTGKKAVPSAKKASGGNARAKAKPVRSAPPAASKKAASRPVASKPGARIKAAGKSAPAKAAPTKPVRAKAAVVSPVRGKTAPAKTAPPRTAPAKSAPATRAPMSSGGDATQKRIRSLEQERAELQDLGNQMKAELDSALAEAERLREQVREMETAQLRQGAAEPGAARPGGFDPAADLDEDISAAPDDDLEETAGFFDRIDEIRARRNELDRERNDRELEQSDQPFWMICPKCGDLMEESEGENVKLERCENCGGLYLDRGEVDLILSLCMGPDAYRRLHNIMKF
jgi:hypothetical protein